MSEHVPGHRLAALQAGELDRPAASGVRSHLAACAECRAAAEQVAEARRGVAEIARDRGPDLAWNLIWPRIRWVTSAQERARRHGRTGRRRVARSVGVAVGAAAACAAVAVGLFVLPSVPSVPSEPADVVAVAAGDSREAMTRLEAAPARRPAEPLVGVLTMVAGQVWVNSSAPRFDEPVEALEILETGDDGRVVVQFGRGSAFSVGPDSSLRIRALDSRSVVLDIRGQVDVEVSHRAEDQRFIVVAGTRRVEVRGDRLPRREPSW